MVDAPQKGRDYYTIFFNHLYIVPLYRRKIYNGHIILVFPLLTSFSYPHMVKKVLILGQIFEMEFWSIYSFWGSLNPKVIFLVIVVYVTSITQFQIWCPIFKSYVDPIWNFSWSSNKRSVYRGTQRNSNTVRPTLFKNAHC